MANDELFEPGKGGEPKPTEPKPAEPKPAAPETVTPAQLEERLNQFGTTISAELRGFGTQVADAIKGVREAGGEVPDPSAVANEVTQRILTGDLSDVDGRVKEILKEVLGPYLSTSIQDRQIEVQTRLETEVEQRFGEGAWEKFVRGDLDKAIEALPLESRGSAAHLKATVDGIIGSKHESMYEYRTEAVRKAKEAEASTGMTTPRMLNTSRPRPATPETYSDDSAAWATHFKDETGKDLDLDHLFKIHKHRESSGGIYRLEDFPTVEETAKGGS